jgi:hypothetical protein
MELIVFIKRNCGRTIRFILNDVGKNEPGQTEFNQRPGRHISGFREGIQDFLPTSGQFKKL